MMAKKIQFTAWSTKQARNILKKNYPKLVKTHKIKTIDPPYERTGFGSAGTYRVVKRKSKR